MAEFKTKGEKFTEELLSGKFKKNSCPNHGENFIGGLEEFHQYLSSCGCFLMDMRVSRAVYHG